MALAWFALQTFESVTQHPDWGGIEEIDRLKIYEAMLQEKDRTIASQRRKNDKLKKQYDVCEGYASDVTYLVDADFGRIRAKDYSEEETYCKNVDRVRHKSGSSRECVECLQFIVGNVEDFYQFYKKQWKQLSEKS